MPNKRYWCIVAARDHVERGVGEGFLQANHGRRQNLDRMQPGDGVVCYSPAVQPGGNQKIQAFTALGYVLDEEVYQVEMTEDFHPYRRRIQFEKGSPAPIRPLIHQLAFIEDKTHWGYPFRRGFFEVPEADFELIRTVMRG